MRTVFSTRNVLKAAPLTLFFAFVFALPTLWWPPHRGDLALAIYLPVLVIAISGACYLTSSQEPISFERAAVVCPVIFGAFLIFVFIYRALCL
jgi:hypothetical protein